MIHTFSIDQRFVKWLWYLDTSCNSIDVAKKITRILVGANWLMSRVYIDDIRVIQKSAGVSMVKMLLPSDSEWCISIFTDEWLMSWSAIRCDRTLPCQVKIRRLFSRALTGRNRMVCYDAFDHTNDKTSVVIRCKRTGWDWNKFRGTSASGGGSGRPEKSTVVNMAEILGWWELIISINGQWVARRWRRNKCRETRASI